MTYVQLIAKIILQAHNWLSASFENRNYLDHGNAFPSRSNYVSRAAD
jgi:hypothetical protein